MLLQADTVHRADRTRLHDVLRRLGEDKVHLGVEVRVPVEHDQLVVDAVPAPPAAAIASPRTRSLTAILFTASEPHSVGSLASSGVSA